MKFRVITLFPEILAPSVNSSILGRAIDKGHISVEFINPRDFTDDPHRSVDDYPYGGGQGMVLMPEPLGKAIDSAKSKDNSAKIILLTPQGLTFDSSMAKRLAQEESLVLVAGHYEGFDERIRSLVDMEVSVGDFVLTGGEIPAMLVIDAISRLVPGVLGDEASAIDDSYFDGVLEGPQYTRPAVWRGMEVPKVLLSGDRLAIARWRRRESLRRTLERRPELLKRAILTYEDRVMLSEIMVNKKD
jgi:tRNA (guanine37-N1)-methyltransferase